MFITLEVNSPVGDDTSVGREGPTFGEFGFRGSGAGFRRGSLMSHLCINLASKSANARKLTEYVGVRCSQAR